MKIILTLATLALTTLGTFSSSRPIGISGDYLEVRSCDVYTGSCVANSEMGLSGREGILVWTVKQGTWKNTALDGLSIIAVVRTDNTLGDLSYQPRDGKAVIIVDARASTEQRAALLDFARDRAGSLLSQIAVVETAPIVVNRGLCSSGSCATVKAGRLVDIVTRCLNGKDHLCGNEDNFYPPLTAINGAFSAFTELATFKGAGLNLTWELTGQRSAYLGTFAL